MIYCMSDIHGEYDRFQKTLELIKFSDFDTLYIIGDVIDRKPGGIDILKQIMSSSNMVLLLGNHEQMCLDTLVQITYMAVERCGFKMEAATPTAS